jgi:signal transduction histidine kinase
VQRRKEADVARRWRIRYKLLFGFGLILGIMALLLLGTLLGLRSYYLTMNAIRSKTAELKAAQEVKEVVAVVIRFAEDPQQGFEPPAPLPTALPPLLVPPGQGAPAAPVDFGTPPRTLHEAVALALRRLDDYEAQVHDTLSHGGSPLQADDALVLIRELRQQLPHLEAAVHQARPRMGTMAADQKMEEQERGAVKDLIGRIRHDIGDLSDYIYRALKDHIDGSRSHYQITLWISIPTSVVGLLLICGLLRSLYGWIFFPIRDLGEGVARVGRGEFSRPIEVHSGDEMEDLAAAFNNMMQRLNDFYSELARQVNERSRQLVRSERLASVGFLAAGVAHEINNPLASIAFCSEALEARLDDLLRQLRPGGRAAEEAEVFQKYLKMIQEEAFRCKSITESLLDFSRSGEHRREPTDLRALIQSVLDVTQHLHNHRGKRITLEVNTEGAADGQVTAWVNTEEIKSVVLNLVTNALESMDEGGHLVIRLRQVGDRAEMQFADNGCGMTAEVLENIFEPFFTRSRSGKGTGLGLTISHRIIQQHGGEVEAASPGPNQGSTFTVRLPLRPPEEPTAGEAGPDLKAFRDGRPATAGQAA